jgi:hypothetical protein
MRVPSLIKQLLEEVRAAPLVEAGRTRLAEAHRRSIGELELGLAPKLIEELERITLPLATRRPTTPSGAPRGSSSSAGPRLFHGIQPPCFSEEMTAQQQLQIMRRALPPTSPGQDCGPGQHRGPGTRNRPDLRRRIDGVDL